MPSSQPAIEVSGLSKRYVLEHESRHDNLRDTLHHTARKLWRRARWGTHFETEEFWALRDVSFKVPQGEVMGIIGRNGAGKSTLLKILSRITESTTGRVTLRGRVASLLEVGTGFHPDLTGRENIFLNGAILGMSRAEIRSKFDEIVAFAEVEKFLDTPVKRYSSGMYVRLAFSVAAHLEPEILIVDEVLAVGDAAFQKKCLGKMQDVARGQGRTVLFVSHQLPAIRELCHTALLLNAGQIEASGPCKEVLTAYQHGLTESQPTAIPTPNAELRTRAYASELLVEHLDGRPGFEFPLGQPWRIRLRVVAVRPQKNFVAAIGLKSMDGVPAQTAWHPPLDLEAGSHEFVFTQDRVVLEAGAYSVVVGLSENDHLLQQFEATRIEFSSQSAVGYYGGTAGVGMVLNSLTSHHRKL